MNELIEFLTSKEIVVVYVVAAIACFLCFIIYLIDKNYYKRKRKHNTRELNKLVEEVNKELEEDGYIVEEEVYDTPVLAPITEEVEEIEYEEVIIAPLEEKNIEDIIIENMEDVQFVEEPEIEAYVEESIEETPIELEEEELIYTDIEPNKEEAQAELKKLTEELTRAEEMVKNIDLTTYEEEQEENAIISLEELIKKSKDMYEQNELTQYADEGNEPISLQDLEIKMKEYKINEPTTVETIIEQIEQLEEPVIEQPIVIESKPVIEQQKLVLDDFNTVKVEPIEEVKQITTNAYQTTKKFKSSPVISPIYGIRPQNELELENTANYEKLDEEIKKTNDFVMTLKELQSHLD